MKPTKAKRPTTPAAVPAAQDRLWKEAWAWGDKQFAEVDRNTVNTWISAGMLSETGRSLLGQVVQWHDTVFTVHYTAAKAAITAAGGWVEPDWASWPACPHGFYAFYAQRIG